MALDKPLVRTVATVCTIVILGAVVLVHLTTTSSRRSLAKQPIGEKIDTALEQSCKRARFEYKSPDPMEFLAETWPSIVKDQRTISIDLFGVVLNVPSDCETLIFASDDSDLASDTDVVVSGGTTSSSNPSTTPSVEWTSVKISSTEFRVPEQRIVTVRWKRHDRVDKPIVCLIRNERFEFAVSLLNSVNEISADREILIAAGRDANSEKTGPVGTAIEEATSQSEARSAIEASQINFRFLSDENLLKKIAGASRAVLRKSDRLQEAVENAFLVFLRSAYSIQAGSIYRLDNANGRIYLMPDNQHDFKRSYRLLVFGKTGICKWSGSLRISKEESRTDDLKLLRLIVPAENPSPRAGCGRSARPVR